MQIDLSLVAAVSGVSCSKGQDYLKVIKQTSEESGESFDIVSGEKTLYSSPSNPVNQQRTYELCLDQTTNNQYTLRMKGSEWYWSIGSWIALYGINGNLVFKGYMDEGQQQDYSFSLYAPIGHDMEWMWSTTSSPNWNQYSFNDASWNTLTAGSSMLTTSNTVFLRRSFVGISGMAAIDLQFMYQFGTVAYINGEEVFRDNMPDGEITSTTNSIQSYSHPDYHGIIRSAYVAENEESVLAVELHFPDDVERSVSFNALLAFLTGISSTNPCFVTTGYKGIESGSINKDILTDLEPSFGDTVKSFPDFITMEWFGSSLPMINSVRFYGYLPYYFTLEGFNDNNERHSFILSSNYSLPLTTLWTQLDGVSSSQTYKYMKIAFHRPWHYELSLFQMQFLVCNRQPQVIKYPHSHYSFIKSYESVTVAPVLFGFKNCRVSPALPSGLEMSPDTCVISGIPTEVVTDKEYRVTGTSDGKFAEGVVTITVQECNGSVYRIENPTEVAFGEGTIRDASDNTVLYDYDRSHYEGSSDWTHTVCITAERFRLEWTSINMGIFVYSLLPDGEEELIGKVNNWQNNLGSMTLFNPSIPHSSQWFYHMGDAPENWYDSNTNGWSLASRGSYPDSTNRIQLYKQSFSVSSLSDVMGVVLSIRYLYGCVVYLNGHEAWRNGVSGDLATAVVTNSYDSLMYRVVSLPNTVYLDGSTVSYLKEGTNSIAIAIIAPTDELKESLFDATVRLIDVTPVSRVWEYTGVFNSDEYVNEPLFDWWNLAEYLSSYNGNPDYIKIKLNNNRREWINSLLMERVSSRSPDRITVYARNTDDDEWTLLLTKTELDFTNKEMATILFIENSIPYNQFMFTDFMSDAISGKEWNLYNLDLRMDNTFSVMEPDECDSSERRVQITSSPISSFSIWKSDRKGESKEVLIDQDNLTPYTYCLSPGYYVLESASRPEYSIEFRSQKEKEKYVIKTKSLFHIPPPITYCPAIGSYPSVAEGKISKSTCPYGFNGYSYRLCKNGALGAVRMEHCIPDDEKWDFTCDRKGYVQYLRMWGDKKGTSRDVNSEEFQTRLEYFIDSCEKIHEWNKMGKYRMEFTFFADWHPEEFEELTTTKQRYSGVKVPSPFIIPVYNNTNYRYLMPSMDPCNENDELRELISKPQNCSVSWAFAITNSIEYAIKKMYFEEYDQIVEVSLSAQELIDCVRKEHGVVGKVCDGMPLIWGFDYIYENGIAYSEFYHHTNVEGECKKIDEKKKYHIAGYEKPSAYNKLGLFDLMMKGPVAVTLGLDSEFFQYYRSDREEGPYFNTAFWRPSVNGVVVEYSQYDIDGMEEESKNPYFAIETRLRACDSMVFRLPILEMTYDANIGGIAGFAIRPIITEPIPIKPTMEPTEEPTTALKLNILE